MHIKVSEKAKLSTSTVIGVLRKLLLDETEKSDLQRYFRKIARGDIPLVVAVNRADLMASLLNLKKEVAPGMKMVFEGAAEAWLIPHEIQKANVGVIVNPPRSLPSTWDQRRTLPGLPLSNSSLPAFLTSHGIKVGLGINEEWVSRMTACLIHSADIGCFAKMARNTRLEMAWEYTNGNGVYSKATALDLVTSNLRDLLGFIATSSVEDASWVAFEGDPFALQATVKAVRGEGRAHVNVF
jgi:hypothetical protein